MIFEKKGTVRKHDVQYQLTKSRNPTIKTVVCYSDRDKKSVETMTNLFLKEKSPFTVLFVRD